VKIKKTSPLVPVSDTWCCVLKSKYRSSGWYSKNTISFSRGIGSCVGTLLEQCNYGEKRGLTLLEPH